MHLVDASLFYSAQSGGVLTYLRAKSDWLARRAGVRHTLLAPSQNQLRGSTTVSVPSLPIPLLTPFRMPLSVTRSAEVLAALQPDLIEVGDPYQFAWAALRHKERCGTPLIGFYHSDLPAIAGQHFGAAAQAAAAAYVRRVYAGFDLVLAPSRVMVARLRQLGIQQARHQPLGVDTTCFSPARRIPDLRKQLGIAANARLLVFAGRLTRAKKLPLLIDAVRRLGAPYHLLLIGSGAVLPQESCVTTIGYCSHRDALAPLLASCDALVHPGDQETFGLIVLEAMASGLPVVGMAAGGVAELVDAESGVLVPPNSAAMLTEGIRALFERDLCLLGANARTRVLAQYDWQSILPQVFAHTTHLLAASHCTAAPAVRSPYVIE